MKFTLGAGIITYGLIWFEQMENIIILVIIHYAIISLYEIVV